jgi:hypothetical protein
MPVRLTPAVKAGADEPPTREHGRWQFAGSDYKRKAAKWRCPTKERKPGSRWIKASRLHTLIPRQRPLAQALHEDLPPLNVGRLKHEWSLLPIRVRGIEPVRLHADLTILAKLACALARARPRTARGVAVRSRTHAWSAVLHPALHSPLQGSASARPVDQPVSKECSGTNAELPMSTPSFANPS